MHMNNQWKAFLESRSARIDENGVTEFPDTPGMPGEALCDLSYLGLIRANGSDAEEFLQGQFTNDIRALKEDQCQLSSMCNPKGRMFANFWIFRQGDDIYLQMPHETLAPTLKRLSMFVLRSQVSLVDASEDLVCIGAIGEQTEAQLRETIPSLPDHSRHLIRHEGMTIIRQPGITPRYKIIGKADAVQALWQQLETTATPTDTAYWKRLDIKAGIPTVYGPTAEAFIPQMVNMQLIEGISFTKGCYCGQEIVARTQYRGTLKRRMYLAHIEDVDCPAPGAELFSPSAEHEQGAGMVVDAQPAENGSYDALVMAQIACAEADDLRLGDGEGTKLSIGTLPYDFESDA